MRQPRVARHTICRSSVFSGTDDPPSQWKSQHRTHALLAGCDIAPELISSGEDPNRIDGDEPPGDVHDPENVDLTTSTLGDADGAANDDDESNPDGTIIDEGAIASATYDPATISVDPGGDSSTLIRSVSTSGTCAVSPCFSRDEEVTIAIGLL